MENIILDFFGQIVPGGACLSYYDQGLALALRSFFYIIACLALAGLAIDYIVDKQRKLKRRKIILLTIFATSLALTFLHRTDECNHGGLLVDYEKPLFILSVLFFVVVVAVMIHTVYLWRKGVLQTKVALKKTMLK